MLLELGLGLLVYKCPFQQYFSYFMASIFISIGAENFMYMIEI